MLFATLKGLFETLCGMCCCNCATLYRDTDIAGPAKQVPVFTQTAYLVFVVSCEKKGRAVHNVDQIQEHKVDASSLIIIYI